MTGPSCAAITRFVTPTWTSTTFLEGDLAVVGTVKLRCSFACHQGDVLSSLVNRISNPGPTRCGKSCATPGVRNRALVVLRIWTTIGDHLRGPWLHKWQSMRVESGEAWPGTGRVGTA